MASVHREIFSDIDRVSIYIMIEPSMMKTKLEFKEYERRDLETTHMNTHLYALLF